MTDLPPSARYVRHVIEEDGPIRRQDLLDELDLPESTIRYAIGQLKERGAIKTEPVMGDGRQIQYNIQH